MDSVLTIFCFFVVSGVVRRQTEFHSSYRLCVIYNSIT
jgi:hypothetical protein